MCSGKSNLLAYRVTRVHMLYHFKEGMKLSIVARKHLKRVDQFFALLLVKECQFVDVFVVALVCEGPRILL